MRGEHTVDSGALRYLIELQAKNVTTETDEGGGTPGQFTTFESVWANVRAASGYEVTTAMQRSNQISHIVEIRYYSGFKTEWRILHDGRVLSVVGLRDTNERKRLMRIECIERKDLDQRG